MMTKEQKNRETTPPESVVDGSSPPGGIRRVRRISLWACLAVGGILAAGYYWQISKHSLRDSNAHSDVPITDVWAKALSTPPLTDRATLKELEQETMRVVEQFVADCPNTPASLHQRARLQYTLGKVDDAQKTWMKCLQLDPVFPEAHYGLGYMAWEQSDYVSATDHFLRVLGSCPDDLRIPYLLGDALMKQGKMREAVAVLERNVQTGNASVAVIACLGQAYLQLREYERAKRAFEIVIQADPNHKQAHYGLAKAHARLGEREESQQCMEKFKSLTTKSLREHAHEIRAFDDVESARELLTSTYTEIGKAYSNQGLNKEAEEMWQRAAILDSAALECRTRLLRFYDLNKRTDEAVQICKQLCRVESGNSNHWHDLAVLCGEQNRWDDARQAIEMAVKLDPDNESYRKTYDIITNAR